jgi:hypothetical protein
LGATQGQFYWTGLANFAHPLPFLCSFDHTNYHRSNFNIIVDPCLFLRSYCILVVYVNDCLLFSKDSSVLDTLIASLKQEFILTMEGDVSAFLSIDIKTNKMGNLS